MNEAGEWPLEDTTEEHRKAREKLNYEAETRRLEAVRDEALRIYGEHLQRARWAEDQAEQAHEELDKAITELAQHLGLVRRRDEQELP